MTAYIRRVDRDELIRQYAGFALAGILSGSGCIYSSAAVDATQIAESLADEVIRREVLRRERKPLEGES